MLIVKTIFRLLRSWLHTSSHFHIREHGVTSLNDAVRLIDRFIDGNLEYPLEWDDFISWRHDNIEVDNLVDAIGRYEPLLFSKKSSDRTVYVERLLEERNRVAALIGVPTRDRACQDNGVKA